jgi:hypothetical protein
MVESPDVLPGVHGRRSRAVGILVGRRLDGERAAADVVLLPMQDLPRGDGPVSGEVRPVTELLEDGRRLAALWRDCTAFHEAGHATVAIWFGMTVESATVESGIMRMGHARIGPSFDWASLDAANADAIAGRPISASLRQRVEAHCLMLMAGRMAEDRAVMRELVSEPEPEPGPEPGSLEAHLEGRRAAIEQSALEAAARSAGEVSIGDDAMIGRLTAGLSASELEADALAGWLRARCWHLLDLSPVWAAITAVAEALQERDTLTGIECSTLVASAVKGA